MVFTNIKEASKQILFENLKIISPQFAKDNNLFGPIYHGTSSDKLEKIYSRGFNIFVGHDRSGNVTNGYQCSDYYGGIPSPIHHMGYGVYFTTVQAIAKKFGEGNNKIGPYFVDAPHMEIINFGAPRTMMKWWLENGYDYKKSPETLFGTGQTNLSLIRQERLRATQNMTNFLKARYDAIWYKGKGMYRLLDGDQVVVFDPSKIYKVNKEMAQPGEIGSKVISKIGIDPYGRGEIKIPMGTKGTIIDKKKPTERQKWAEGSEWIYHIKWDKGGTMYDVLDKWIEPYTKKSKLSESDDKISKEKPYYRISKLEELQVIDKIEKEWGIQIGKTLKKIDIKQRQHVQRGYTSAALTELLFTTDVIEYEAIFNGKKVFFYIHKNKNGNLEYAIKTDKKNFNYSYRSTIKENKEKPYYQISKIEEEKAVYYIQKNWDKLIGKTLHKTMDTRREEDSESFKDILRYEGNAYSGHTIRFYFEKFKGGLYYKAVGNDREFLNSWTLIPNATINENKQQKPYYHISKREELEAINWIQKEWFWLIGKTLNKRSEDRKEDVDGHFFDFMSFKADVGVRGVTEYKQLFFYLEKTEHGLHYMVLDEAEDKIIRKWSNIPITLDPIQENTKKQEIYHHINRVTEQQCINYINKEWGDIIGKTLTKFHEGRRLQSIGNNLLDTIEYMASDKQGFSLLFTIQSTVTNTIDMFVATHRSVKYVELGGWDKIPNVSTEKLNESKQTSKVHYKLSKEAELQAVNHIQRELHGMIGKTLKKHSERRDEYRNWGIVDIIIYEAKNEISGEKMFIYIQSTPDGGVAYEGINRIDGKDYPWFWEPVPGAESTLVKESVDRVPYYPISKMEEHQALDVLLKTRKQFQYKNKRTFKKIGDERHVRVPTYFVDQIKYEVIVDDKKYIVSLEKADDGMMYHLSGNDKHPGQWDWVDPIRSNIKSWTVIDETIKENDAEHEDALNKTGYWGSKGAGAIILAKNTGRILLPHRSSHVEQPHTWGVWGGAIDPNEDPVSAVKREISEEVGYHGTDMELIPLYVYSDSKAGFQYHNFLAVVPQEFTPKLNWETEGYRWVVFGEWPTPLHFGLKALLQNDGNKIISVIEKLKVIPLKKEKVDREKYQAAIHLIRLTWEDMRRGGAYKDRFDFDNEFVHWMLNSESLQNLAEKYGTLFFPNAHEPGHEFQQYVEKILEILEIKYNDRRIKKIDKSDPLFLLKEVVRGKTWESAKQAIRALSTSGGKYVPRKMGDDEVESVFNRLYRIALGETFWSEKEMSQYRPLSSYILTANSPENEIIFFRYYSDKGQFPADAKVYRGLNSPTSTIRPGDHVSFDKGFARGYEVGKYGAVISAVLPSKDLLVKKMDVGSTELIYWPPGHKIKEIENVPTFKQFYNQWAFP